MKSFGSQPQGERLERMRASPLWVGNGFRNIHPILPGLRDSNSPHPSIKNLLCSDELGVPQGELPQVDPRKLWLKKPQSGLRATWLGHSTVLLEMDGFRVLTDPVWGTRASPFRIIGPKRFQPMPVRLNEMPEVDVVVISHDHYDHLDFPTISALAKFSKVPFVTSLGVGAHLELWGVSPERITELDWWESHTVPNTGITITAAPSQHFSGRKLNNRNATLWSSLVITSENHKVFFSGDTGLTNEYQNIRDILGPFDLVMLEVGAFHPSWGDIHLGPKNALQAHEWLGGGKLLPIHWGTFRLAPHPWTEPAETLIALADKTSIPLLFPKQGEPLEPIHDEAISTWWRDLPHTPASKKSVPDTEAELNRKPDFAWPLD